LRAVWDADAEARWVGDEIEALQRKRHALAEIAILVRAGFQTREFEERFHHARPALSGGRRAALLRAPGDPRRARLSAPHPSAGRRSRLRAHRQHAAPRHRRRTLQTLHVLARERQAAASPRRPRS